jgi:hypothetical protein
MPDHLLDQPQWVRSFLAGDLGMALGTLPPALVVVGRIDLHPIVAIDELAHSTQHYMGHEHHVAIEVHTLI